MTKTRRKPRRILPWWLADGSEVCPACSQAYAYHTQVRCEACDEPLCPFCVQVTVTMEVSCPSCIGFADESVRAGE